MKRWFILLLLTCMLLVIPSHASGVSSWTASAVVDSDGSAQMEVRMVISLEEEEQELVIPLGKGARRLTVNGAKYRIRPVEGVPSAVLKSEAGFSGTMQFDLSYTLVGCLDTEKNWDLVLPLLAGGLAYGVEHTEFQVTLPAASEAQIQFESGYMGTNADNYITCNTEGNVITGSVNAALRDHENLTFRMETAPEVFPRTGEPGKIRLLAMAVSAILLIIAAVYWYFRLSWLPISVQEQTAGPDGINPGLVGCYLFGKKPDFALMILSWAQQGYLTVHANRDQSVTLYKRMDMRNEQSPFEEKIFASLFGKGTVAEVSGRSYQKLKGKVNGKRLKLSRLYEHGGKPTLLRILGCLSAAFGVLALADGTLPAATPIRNPVLGILFIIGGIIAWQIHGSFRAILIHRKKDCMRSLIAILCWLLLGAVVGAPAGVFLIFLIQLLLGISVTFGGKRSAEGRCVVQALLGYRKYMRTISSKRINRMIGTAPGNYYTMSIFALALGVDKPLAKRFAPAVLPECSWLISDLPQEPHSSSFYLLLRQTAEILRSKSGYQTKEKSRIKS